MRREGGGACTTAGPQWPHARSEAGEALSADAARDKSVIPLPWKLNLCKERSKEKHAKLLLTFLHEFSCAAATNDAIQMKTSVKNTKPPIRHVKTSMGELMADSLINYNYSQ